MLEQILTGNPHQEVVNFLAGDSLLGNAKSKPLWPLLLQKLNMLLLQAAVAVWKSHVCITRKSWPLFKSKKIAQVVRAWIQSKNSLVKHFEDMRLCRPSKEYLPVWFDPPRDESMSCLTTKGMHNIGAVCARQTFLSKVTPLIDTNAVQPISDEGASSERLSDAQPTPSSCNPLSKSQMSHWPDSSSHAQPSGEPTGVKLGDHSSNITSFQEEMTWTLQNV
ncbi:hypothetical protein Tco_0067130 [Tanacetum coccineum]